MTAPGTTETRLTADLGEIRRTLDLVLRPGQVTELRALDVSTSSYRRPHTVSGYFDDVETLIDALGYVERTAKGIYFTPNPVNAALLARAVNRLRDVADREPLTGDRDIISRRWLLIDADPCRPAGISSTDGEHDLALERVRQIRDMLARRGWPDPLLCDSGNGGHLLYPIAVPRDDAGLVTRVLQALGFQFDDHEVTIDQTVFNPARIWKLHGTVARKGDSTPDRPHRLARILEAPTALTHVSRDLLEALAGTTPESEARQATASGSGGAFDLDTWIGRSGLELQGPSPWQGGRRWIFRGCPWNPDHCDRSAYLLQHASGAIAAGCHHNGCAGRNWHDLRDVVEPGWRDVRGGGSPSVAGGGQRRWRTEERPWPEPPGRPAFMGLAGRVVETVEPHTEADPVAVLVSFIIGFGCAVGSGPHALVGATRHPPREYAAVVGRTSKARKGDSWQPNKTLFTLAAPEWSGRLMGGLSSGEGLISAVRDPVVKTEPIKEKGRIVGYEEVVVDEGEPDVANLLVRGDVEAALIWEPTTTLITQSGAGSIVATQQELWEQVSGARETEVHVVYVTTPTIAQEYPALLRDVNAAQAQVAGLWRQRDARVVDAMMKVTRLPEEIVREALGRTTPLSGLPDRSVDTMLRQIQFNRQHGTILQSNVWTEDPAGVRRGMFVQAG